MIMTSAKASQAVEKPLGVFSRCCVALGAVFLVTASYLFWMVSVVLLLALLLLDLVLWIALVRFGRGYIATLMLRRHSAFLFIFVRALILKDPPDPTVALTRDDAPLLFDTVEKLARKVEVAAPKEIVLEMGANAWIHLKGWTRGSSNARLGIGYDFLLGLGPSELEAVITHEMAHAKLIQRGFNRWLGRSMARVSNLTSALLEQQTRLQQGPNRQRLSPFSRIASVATRWGIRLMATYYRQDEFEADMAAAKIAGVDLYCQALRNTYHLGFLSAQLSWRERIARLQRGEGFHQWLKQELTLKENTRAHKRMRFELRQSLANKYSTHPSLKDRIDALGGNADAVANLSAEPAISFLAHSDEVLEKLIAKLQEIIAKQEEEDTRSLLRFTRRVNRSRKIHLSLSRLLALILQVGAVIALLCAIFGAYSPDQKTKGLLCAAAAFAAGVFLHNVGRFRDRFGLPIPSYEDFKKSYEAEWTSVKIMLAEKRIEEDLNLKINALKRSDKVIMKFLIREGYDALRACDYLRANVIARHCLRVDEYSVEGNAMLAISAAYFGNQEHMDFGLGNILRVTRIKGPLNWVMGWSLMLSGQMPQAEAYLLEAARHFPSQPVVLMLLAVSQMTRTKLHSAVTNARKASLLAPNNKPLITAMVRMLLESGFVREAGQNLRAFESDFPNDIPLMLCIIHLNLLSGHQDEAQGWFQHIQTHQPSTAILLELADIYNRVRSNPTAEKLYKIVIQRGYYPSAHLGLAQVYARLGREEEARSQLASALNVVKPVANRAAHPLQLLEFILTELADLSQPNPSCTAWIATLDLSNSPVRIPALNFLVYAPGIQEAKDHVQFLYKAMHPDRNFNLERVRMVRASQRMQPDVPVCPGVQTVLI